MLTAIEQLQAEITKQFPCLHTKLDRPVKETGNWFLDVSSKTRHICVVWREDRGFGFSIPTFDDYGTGADEIYPTVGATLERIVQVLGMLTPFEAGVVRTLFVMMDRVFAMEGMSLDHEDALGTIQATLEVAFRDETPERLAEILEVVKGEVG